MYKKLFPLVGLLAALAANSLAQNNSPQNVSGPNASVRLTEVETSLGNLLETDDDVSTGLGRARIVEVKKAAVKSSVIVNIASVERVVFEMVNQKRAENGLAPLSWNNDLEAIARGHSQKMADFTFFSHRGLDNKMVSDRADDAKLGRWRAIGENIAFNRGYHDPIAKAVDLWLNSPSHRQNMMNSEWKDSAIGVAVAEDGSYYFTQVFLRK